MTVSAPPVRDLPVRLTLTGGTWRAAAVVAGLRLASNDRTRTARRDQGLDGNVRNDVLGALAELVGRYALEKGLAHGPVRGVLLDPAGAVDDVDASFLDVNGLEQRVEVKGHLRQARYTRFAINDEAHRRSASRGATGYLGVLAAPGGPEAVVSTVVPLPVVAGWQIQHLNPARNDPARVVPLLDFRRLYTGGLDVDPGQTALVGPQELTDVVRVARRRLDEVGPDDVAALNGTAVQARTWAEGALARWR